MNSKERVLGAIEGKNIDRTPFDLGSTKITGMTKGAYQRILDFLGYTHSEDTVKIIDYMLQLAELPESFLKALNVDTRGIMINGTTTRKRPEVRDKGKYLEYTDEYQCKFKKHKTSGLYFDLFESPLSGEIDRTTVESFPWPDTSRKAPFKAIKNKAKSFSESGYPVVLEGEGGGIYETASRVRGYTDLYKDIVKRPELAKTIFDKVTELRCKLWKTAADEVGQYVHVVREGDDLADQENLLISPSSYKRLLKPCHKKVVEVIKESFDPNTFVLFHSDGAIREIIPEFIECGIDILNPIQPGIPGMDLVELVKEFGEEIAFWGAGPNPQTIFPSADPNQVEKKVKEKLSKVSNLTNKLIFSPIHNIQQDVPPENILAMINGLNKHRGIGFNPKELNLDI